MPLFVIVVIVGTLLPSLGFDNSVRALGVMPAASNPSRIVTIRGLGYKYVGH